MQALTIGELERVTGVPRSTVYFYVREGYLPPAQKAAASRGIYTEAHVDLLREIARLKDEGLPLDEIRVRVEPQVQAALVNEVDLVARQVEHNRRTIIEAAALQFARKGYKRTRISDIIRDVGVSPPAFYAQFHSKRQLFLESFTVFLEWMKEFIEPQLAGEPDPAVRFLYRTAGHYGLQAISPDLFSLTRAEALHEGGEMRQVAVHTLRSMTQEVHEYLHTLARGRAIAAAGVRGVARVQPARVRWTARCCGRRGTTRTRAATPCGPTCACSSPSKRCTRATTTWPRGRRPTPTWSTNWPRRRRPIPPALRQALQQTGA